MSESETIYEAFGDASTGLAGTFYGFVLIPEVYLTDAMHRVEQIKQEFGGTALHRIHCREIFNEDQRNKSNWAHLRLDETLNMCGSILDAIDSLGANYALGFLPVENYPDSFMLRGKNDHKDLVHPIDDKWRELWTFYRAAMLLDPVERKPPPCPIQFPTPDSSPHWHFVGPLVAPGYKVRNIYLDREKTKIRWFTKNLQWTEVAKTFVSSGPEGESFLPIQQNSDCKHPMLDIADIFAWNIARSFTDNPIIIRSKVADISTVMCRDMGKQIVLG